MTNAPHGISRRETLGTRPNPNREVDYVVLLGGTVRPRGVAVSLNLALRYVPDRLIVETGGWQRYLEALAETSVSTLEDLAALILTDTNNEVVPRWLSVVVSNGDAGPAHEVIIEDSQPKWDNPDLLRRIPHLQGGAR